MSNKEPAKWDPWKMFDMSKEEISARNKRVELRQSLKAEFQKKFTNPHWKPAADNPATGHIFDPAVQRFISLRRTQWDYFRYNKKRPFAPFFFIVILPVGLLYTSLVDQREYYEKNIRAGNIKYEDRVVKFQ